MLSRIEIGIDRTRPASTGLSHQKNARDMMNADTPHTRPKSVCPPCVRIASRQSVPSSPAPRFCVTHDTPWPSSVKSTNFELKAMLIGASNVDSSASSDMLVNKRRLPPNRSAAAVSPSVTTRLTIFGRKISSMVNAKRVNASGTLMV